MSWDLEFYRSIDGGTPVEAWLDSLSAGEAGRAVRGLDILRTYGTQLGMPHVRDGEAGPSIFGLRRRGQPEHRMFFIRLDGQRLLILHGCTKQAPGTPPADAALARERQQEYLERPAERQGSSKLDDLDRYVEKRTGQDAELRKVLESGETELGFRKAIIGARLAAGLTQGQLAQRLGMGESLVARMEVGAYRPRLETLLRVAAALDATFDVDAAGLHFRHPD